MKILLIQPFGRESNTNYPPLGLLYLFSYLRKYSKHELKILDLRVHKTPIEDKIPDIVDWLPDVIGITGLSIEWSGFKSVALAVRQALGSTVKIVAGGPPMQICFARWFFKMPLSII
ncbi:MAG: cobalamin B12-binding domain-containing protein [Nitrospirae bacterium]|nr:cobalamin B12-binding domain-containing protein [Nitrospirota bacterium]